MISVSNSNFSLFQRPFFPAFNLNKEVDIDFGEDSETVESIEIEEDKENARPIVNTCKIPAQTTDANINKRRAKETLEPNNHKKVKRQYKPFTEGPCSTLSEAEKTNGKSNPDTIRQHAEMRMQLFGLMVIAIQGLAIKSDGTADPHFAIDIGPAYLQLGKATNGKRVKATDKKQPLIANACHDNAAAGYIDNRRNLDKQRIFENKEITPIKENRLRIKGFTDEDLEEIKANINNFDKISEIFDRVWTINPLRPQSILSGTYAELALNSTTEAERGLNLVVDKWVELLRGEIKELYEKVARKEMTPEEACIKYRDLIIDHLLRFEERLKANDINLTKYATEFVKLEKYKGMEAKDFNSQLINEVSEILHNLRDVQLELNPKKMNDSVSSTPRVKLPNNKKFLNESLHDFQNDKESRFFRWIAKKYSDLENEFCKYTDKIKLYIECSQLEREGTKIPDLTALFGEVNPTTGKRELSPENLLAAQQQSWAPLKV